MFSLTYRTLKRALVLSPGLAVAYLSIFDVYPFFHRFTFNVPAFLITYLLAAYVFVPFLLRLINVIAKPKHIPNYCTTPDGYACDPVNIGVIATQKQLKEAMEAAGWHQADNRNIRSFTKLILSTGLRRPYPKAPFSGLYLLGRKQDIGFEQATGKSIHKRHHVRFWAANAVSAGEPHRHEYFWKNYYTPKNSQCLLWVGAASLDTGIGLIAHNAQLTHKVHSDTNAERDFIVAGLQQTGLVKAVRTATIGKPYRLKNRVISRYLQADGKIKICSL